MATEAPTRARRLAALAAHLRPASSPGRTVAAPAAAAEGEDGPLGVASTPEGPLSAAQLRHFLTFGFVQVKAAYTRTEMGEIIPEVFRAAEEMRQRRAGAQGQGQQGGGCLLASSDLLIEKLLADERIFGSLRQLMHGMGERRFVSATASHLRGGRPGAGSPWNLGRYKALAREMPEHFEHGWHADVPGPSFAATPCVKVTMYLTETTREAGALRVLPASHTVESQVSLRRLQASHGLNTAHADWAESTFGVPGPELPCTILESTPGDVLFTHNSLFHAVYNHRPDRQMMQCPPPSARPAIVSCPFLCV